MLLIHGSNRKNKTSYQFAKAFESVSGQGCDILWVHDYLGKIRELLEIIDKHSVIVLRVPLYVDTLPAAVIEIMEDLSPYKERLNGKGLFSLAQSGFPDETRMTPLSLTCKCFAEEMGLQWLGALVHGGGVIIDGRPISDLGKKGDRLMEGGLRAGVLRQADACVSQQPIEDPLWTPHGSSLRGSGGRSPQ